MENSNTDAQLEFQEDRILAKQANIRRKALLYYLQMQEDSRKRSTGLRLRQLLRVSMLDAILRFLAVYALWALFVGPRLGFSPVQLLPILILYMLLETIYVLYALHRRE